MSMAEIATLGASGGTLILAAVAVWQSFQTKAQIQLGKNQLKASEDAALRAAKVHQEAIRARVDVFAPRISVLYGAVGGPCYSPQAIDSHLRLAAIDSDTATPASGKQFVLPRDGERYLWFYGAALVINEGSVTARVRLPGGARFVSGHSVISREDVDLPSFRETGVFDEAILAPGQHAQFQWSEGKAVSKWAESSASPGKPLPGGSIWLWAVVFDARDDGTIETLMAHLKPHVLEAVDGTTGIWRVTDATIHEMVSLPIRRRYRSEGHETEDVSQMHEYHGVDERGSSLDKGHAENG